MSAVVFQPIVWITSPHSLEAIKVRFMLFSETRQTLTEWMSLQQGWIINRDRSHEIKHLPFLLSRIDLVLK